MSDHSIKYGDASFVLVADLPDRYGNVTSGTCSIANTEGSVLDYGAITIATATTLAAVAGPDATSDSAITVASVTGMYVDDLIKIAGDEGTVLARIKGIDTGNKILELDHYLNTDFAIGDAVTLRTVRYTVDVSTVATFPKGLELVVRWGMDEDGAPDWDTDDVPFLQSAVIDSFTTQISGLQSEFARTYERYYKMINPDTWAAKEDLIWDTLNARFDLKGRDLRYIVKQDEIRPLFLAEMAYHIALTGDSSTNDEVTRLAANRDQILTVFSARAVWSDDDQDGAEDEEETQPAVLPMPYRRL